MKVGDILYSSWGYDQTNIDYYVVTKVLSLDTVEIAEVGEKIVRSDNYGSDYVVPDVSRKGKTMKKRVTYYGYSKGDVNISIRIDSVQTAWVWNGKPLSQTAFGYGH